MPPKLRGCFERIWEHPRVRGWGLPQEPPQVPAGLSHADAYRFAVEAPFRAYASLAGKSRWGDKTPAYLHHVNELLAIWPDARFIVLVRDGRDVALSIVGLPFGPNNVWAAARCWAAGIRRGQETERRHPDQVLTLRYEDLASEPRREVERICAFLGLAFDEEMLAIERTDAAKLAEGQEGWFTNVWAGINTSAVGEVAPADDTRAAGGLRRSCEQRAPRLWVRDGRGSGSPHSPGRGVRGP